MIKPVFSVVIPVYNTEDYLEECIESVLAQKFEDFEILLIDDGSTDNSPLICDHYSLKDSRIIVEHKINGGVSTARNIALQKAKGEYIVFLDSDDLLPKGAFLEYIHTLDNINPVDMIIGRTARFIKNKEQSAFINREFDIDKFKTATANEIMMCCVNREITNSVWGNLYRRSTLQNPLLEFDTQLSMAEDGDWLYRFILRASNFCATNKCVYLYRQDPDARYYLKSKFCHAKSSLAVSEKWFDYFLQSSNSKDRQVIASRFANRYLSCAIRIASLSGIERKEIKKLFQSRRDIFKSVTGLKCIVLAKTYQIFGFESFLFFLILAVKIKGSN